jgi:NAD(P)-dependent dehydrogenase (short-subunit alcohol dehydrogenase family)
MSIIPPFSVKDKVIFITGAAGQIGTQITSFFLNQGAKVVATDNDMSGLSRLKDGLTLFFDTQKLLIFPLDITKEIECNQVVERAFSIFNSIDVLINNAAIDAKFDSYADEKRNESRFEFFPIDALRTSVEVNLIGTVIITQAVIRKMLTQGFGNIINVASTYSVVSPNQSLYDFGNGQQQYKPVDYVASKSFIPNFTRYLATFYARNNIRCNAIVPHGIFNNHSKEFLTNWERLSPMGRMCNRSELDGPFAFLASDASSYMTGATLNVDGGWTAW